jgi:ubiquinone/menaquinone biosynthesis C-methylase UbiE
MKHILDKLTKLPNGIYTYDFQIEGQDQEIEMREKVAKISSNYWAEIAKSHSIPVMYREVKLFLSMIPQNGIILDVGGGYGWHWRDLSILRPDVSVVIVDMLQENLCHAMNILNSKMDKIYLVHGNATDLIFNDDSFDGYWTVQTLQHIPDFNAAIDESHRVLKKGGLFVNYSLNNSAIINFIYTILGKNYHKYGFYCAIASAEQFNYISHRFGTHSFKRFSEVFFQPGLKFTFPGHEGTFIGWIDSKLSGKISILSTIARQQSFHTSKK